MKESTGDNKAERDAVIHAINALKARGCDINPYSVAEEANISRSSLVRSSELMRLLTDARSGKNGNAADDAETMDELRARNETLVHELSQLQWEAGVLRRYFQEAQAENKKLQEEIGKTKEEAAGIAKTINIAWQQGYIAGQQAADANPIVPQKSLVESLKEAAEAATADGARHMAPQAAAAPAVEQAAPEKVPAAAAAQASTAAPPVAGGRPGRTYPNQQQQQQQSAPTAPAESAERQSTIPPPPGETHSTPPSAEQIYASTVEETAERPAYDSSENAAPTNNGSEELVNAFVADVPLHIEDPEVLNDPFTAKLLSALAAEDFDEEDENEITAQAEVIITPPPGAVRTMSAEDLVLQAANEKVDLSYHLDETQEVRALTPQDLMEPLPAELLAEMAKPVLPPLPEPASMAVTSPLPLPQPAPAPAAESPLAELAGRNTGEIPKSEPPVITAAEPHAAAAVVPAQITSPYSMPTLSAAEAAQVAAGGSPHAEPEQMPSATAAHADESGHHGDDEDEEGDPRIRSRYNADELHNLFRNRFVRAEEPQEQPAPAPKVLESSQPMKKFVGSKHSTAEPLPAVARAFPPEIRKACRLLGLTPEEGLTKQMVLDSWKKEMSKPGVHPDTGGDTEMAIYLNTAKDALLRWVEANAPKLGKKFGGHKNPADQQKPKE